jgi:predicted AlkP superfamily phosphohydrolase/phosphomutase
LGLTGLYLNVAGRESQGIVAPGAEAASLKAEIVARLSGLPDEACAETAIVEAFDTASLYRGPFLDDAPDILLGFNRGYRTSWDAAMGIVGSEVFQDNRKCWSGDHCVDPRLVPGVFLSNVPIEREDPRLIDIAPTALRLFGLEPPRHMDGESLLTRPPAGPVPRPGADGEATGDR